MTLYNITAGGFVELAEGFAPSFKKENALFAFDNMKCERTVSFSIPATPQNDRLFVDAKNLNNRGGGMRVRYEAQLQSSLVTLDGDLYITEYENSAYKAVFVTGEMFGLRALKNAGKPSEIISTSIVTTYDSNSYTPSQGKSSTYTQIAYGTNREQPFPSVRLHGVIELAMQALGVPVSLPSSTQYVRIIPAEVNGATETDVTFTSLARAMSETTHTVCYEIQLSALSDLVGITYARVRRNVGSSIVYLGRFEQYFTRQELQLEFPDDWDDDVFVGYFLDGDTNTIAEFSFYGNRSFDENGTVTGESLRGRSVTIPLGGKFVLIDKSCWVNQQTSSGLEKGWAPVGISKDLQISGGEITVGSTVRLQDNLPDTDVVSLLKIVSALSGLQLYYEEGAGVSFVTGEKTGLVTLDGKIIERGNLTRTYADYGQKNVIQFDSEDRMPDRDRVQLEYDVENENLAAEKELLTIPYSEGISNGIYEGQRLIFTREAALADADTNAPAMVKVNLQPNKVLESLCANSTSIQVRAKMSLLEYQQLRVTKYVYYNYAYWMWTDANWSKGVATISLSMVDDDVLPMPEIWLPLDGSYELKGNITSLPTNTDSGFFSIEKGLTLQSLGGAKVNSTVVTSSKGINLTKWNVPYDIFATTRTYAGQTIQATSLTVALWLRMDAADISSYGIDLSQERFGMIFGTPDAYEFFGLIFRTGENAVMPCFGNRNSQTNVLDSYGAMQLDVWAHYAFAVNLEDMSVTGYLNGVQVFKRTHPAFANWIWAMQAPNWRMAGNYAAIRLPFWFKDVRLYNRALTAGQVGKIYLGS